NWALRQIGKRNAPLNRAALAVADEIHRLDSLAAQWIASNARRELASPAVQQRLTVHSAAESKRKIKTPWAKAVLAVRTRPERGDARH
ncbi:MAG TPA: hypothetical protein VEN79_08855, partial [Terriglobia bacterium]|nr:hypothetical protein [Terriglobia bacterium]